MTTRISFPFFSLELELSGTCPGTYDKARSSYITSPNYPQNYGNDADCRWTITILNEGFVVLKFTDFETERGFDSLLTYNGSNDNSPSLEELSGRTIPSDVMFTGKAMYLKFSSDALGNRKGFRIALKTFGMYREIFLDRFLFNYSIHSAI